MNNANLCKQSIHFKKYDFDNYLIREITIKNFLKKNIKEAQKNSLLTNICVQKTSDDSKDLTILNKIQKLQKRDQKDNEKTIKKLHRKKIRKFEDDAVQGIQPERSQFTSHDNADVFDLQNQIKYIIEDLSIQIFQELNINSQLSQNFKTQQQQIFDHLQKKRYYLLNKLNFNQNKEVFEGYQQSDNVISKGVYSQYYFIVIHDLNEENFNSKVLKAQTIKVNDIGLFIDYFNVTQNTKIVVLQRQYYSYLDDQVTDFLPNDFRVWNKQLFNFLNEGLEKHFQNEKEKHLLESYKRLEETILKTLLSNNCYLKKYLNKGGEGIIFEGYREYPQRVYKDLIFKIYFDYQESDIQEEIKIMKLFEFSGNVINLIDHIRLQDSNSSILILEKCQFNLEHELKIFQQKNEFPFEKLIQKIYDLLDGLLQFRIFKILHLDIKPSNILISLTGNYIYTDFDISAVKKQNEDTQVQGCTQFYASPEQKQKDPKIDFKSDIYSLGKTFQQIIKIYKIINKEENDFIECLENVVDQKMVLENCEQRDDCKKIHEILILKLISLDCGEFQQAYLKKIEIIQDLYLYDQNKDITYFLQLNLYFNLVSLRILYQNYLKNKKKGGSQDLQNQFKSIATQLNKIGLCYSNLSKFKQAIKYLLKSLEIRQIIFQVYHHEIIYDYQKFGLNEEKKARRLRVLFQQHIIRNYIENYININHFLFG